MYILVFYHRLLSNKKKKQKKWVAVLGVLVCVENFSLVLSFEIRLPAKGDFMAGLSLNFFSPRSKFIS